MSYIRVNYSKWLKIKHCLPFVNELLIIGRPGGGKTRGVVKALKKIVRNGEKILFLTPLKIHRDIVGKWFSDSFSVLVFKGKQDLCSEVKWIYENGSFIEVLAKCLGCSKKCPFKGQIKSVNEYDVVVSTHAMGLLFSIPIFKFDYLVIDEVDQYYKAFSKKIPVKVVEEREKDKFGRRVASYIKSRFKRILNAYVPRVVLPRSRHKVFITATAPKDAKLLNYIIGEWDSEGFCTYFLPYENKDKVLVYDKVLLWGKHKNWLPQILTVIKEICNIERSVGIVSRNYEVTRVISEYLKDSGFNVLDDYNNINDINKASRIHIITVNSKACRGVSLPDKDIVIALFQYMQVEKRGFHIKYYLEECPIEKLGKALNYCDNLQAIFRFIRRADREHVVVLLDKRLYTSFKETTMQYYLEDVEKRGEVFKFRDIASLLNKVKDIF